MIDLQRGCLPSYLPSRTDPPVKNAPATAAVMRQARVAAMSALKPTSDRSFVLLGTNAAVPPTNIASEAMWANPQSA